VTIGCRRETTSVSVWPSWLAVDKRGALRNNRRSLSRTLPGLGARREQRAAVQLGAARLGAAVVGAAAVGAGAFGALAIGRLAVGRAVVRHLKIEQLEVNRLHVHEFQVDRQITPAPA
jgi:hypothetical protein